MSSEISTEQVRHESLEPWQFFVLAALVCAAAVTVVVRGQSITTVVLLTVIMATVALVGFMARGQSIAAIILVTVLMGATTIVGIAVLRTVRPLVFGDEDRTQMVGQRTRAALEREKMLALRSIKELEFDRAMGKLSDADWREMSSRLRARAAGLMKQLDAGAGYRDQIERDLAKRLAEPAAATPARGNFCTQCGTKNDGDAKFCKNCGHKL